MSKKWRKWLGKTNQRETESKRKEEYIITDISEPFYESCRITMEHRPFDHDKLSLLSRHFALDVAMAVQLCIDYLEEAITAQPIGKPKKSLLNVAAIDNERYLFSFEGIGVLGTLQFRGFIEPIDKSNTSIKGFVRLSNRALLKNALMILITLLFIRLPYISIAFLLVTVSSLYFDIRLLRNAVKVLEKVFEPV